MDDLDIKIISILHADSRISITELSKLVNLSRPSVSERIEKLINAGIIEKFTLTVDSNKTRFTIICFLEMSNLKVRYEKLEKVLSDLDNIKDIYRVTGKSNYLVKAVFSSIMEMNSVLEELMKYSHVETKVVLDTILYDKLIIWYICRTGTTPL